MAEFDSPFEGSSGNHCMPTHYTISTVLGDKTTIHSLRNFDWLEHLYTIWLIQPQLQKVVSFSIKNMTYNDLSLSFSHTNKNTVNVIYDLLNGNGASHANERFHNHDVWMCVCVFA